MKNVPPPLSARDAGPCISVIMANYQGARHLADAITSVLRQTHVALELIVVDDASCDASSAIVLAAAKRDSRVRLIDLPKNSGPSAARNRALGVAVGDWIAIVDSDDVIHPERFERMLSAALRLSADIVADDLIFFGETADASGRTLLAQLELLAPMAVTAEYFVASNASASNLPPLGYLKPLIRRTVLSELRYEEAIRIGEDYDFYLRLLLAGARFFLLPDALYLYRRHNSSLSHRLSTPVIEAMIKVHDARMVSVTEDRVRLRHVLDERRVALGRQLQYENLTHAIKRGDPVSSLAVVLRKPSLILMLNKSLRERFSRTRTRSTYRTRKTIVLAAAGVRIPEDHAQAERIVVPAYLSFDKTPASSPVWAELSSLAANHVLDVVAVGMGGVFALGTLPHYAKLTVIVQDAVERDRAAALLPPHANIISQKSRRPVAAPRSERPLVHFRTPTYRRPVELARALASMQAQTFSNWVCDVYDDDPEGSGRSVVESLGDARIAWHHNRPQLFASRNIDKCFSRDNPREADWFSVVEDDNLILPEFVVSNLAVASENDVDIVFRNQLVEFGSGTPAARLSATGILDNKFCEGIYEPDLFRLSLISDIGVSNGGLFWSRHAKTDLEIGFECNATLQEYLRTYAVAEPIFVALKPLAVWAENGAGTTRDLGEQAKYLRRELNLKRSVQVLRRHAWNRAGEANRTLFLQNGGFAYDRQTRAAGLAKSLIPARMNGALGFALRVELMARGVLIRTAGQQNGDLAGFLKVRG